LFDRIIIVSCDEADWVTSKLSSLLCTRLCSGVVRLPLFVASAANKSPTVLSSSVLFEKVWAYRALSFSNVRFIFRNCLGKPMILHVFMQSRRHITQSVIFYDLVVPFC